MRQFVPALLLSLLPVAASAEYAPISELPQFLSIIEGRELRYGLFGVSLTIKPDGQIEGSATGYPLTGTWAWQDGYFCREMEWGGTEIPYNCQLVEISDNNKIRFTVDRGAGESAAFSLR